MVLVPVTDKEFRSPIWPVTPFPLLPAPIAHKPTAPVDVLEATVDARAFDDNDLADTDQPASDDGPDSNGNSNPANDEAKFSSGENKSPPDDNADSSRADVSIGEAEVIVAQPQRIIHRGQARVVTTQSISNLRAASAASSSQANLSAPRRIPQSLTMSDINKPLPGYPNGDSIGAYMERDRMKIEAASKKLDDRAKELREFFEQNAPQNEAHFNFERAKMKERLSRSQSVPQLYMVPLTVEEDIWTGPAGQKKGAIPTEARPPSRAPSRAYRDTIRTMADERVSIAYHFTSPTLNKEKDDTLT